MVLPPLCPAGWSAGGRNPQYSGSYGVSKIISLTADTLTVERELEMKPKP